MNIDPANAVTAGAALAMVTRYVFLPVLRAKLNGERPGAARADMVVKAANGSAGQQSKEWWELKFREMFEEYNTKTHEFLGAKMGENSAAIRELANVLRSTGGRRR